MLILSKVCSFDCVNKCVMDLSRASAAITSYSNRISSLARPFKSYGSGSTLIELLRIEWNGSRRHIYEDAQ